MRHSMGGCFHGRHAQHENRVIDEVEEVEGQVQVTLEAKLHIQHFNLKF